LASAATICEEILNGANVARGSHASSSVRDAAVLMLLGVLVNLVHLGSKSILYDESATVLYARLSPLPLFRVIVGSDPNMSLYYLVLGVWVRIFGESEVAVRFPSVLFGALAVGAVYLLGCRLFGRTAGFVAGLFLALNPFMVEYAQTARSYALLALLVTLSSLFFVREIERPSRGIRTGYVIASVLAVYAHYFAVYVLAAHALTLVALRRRSALTREWLSVAGAILASCVPAMLIISRSGAADRIGWIQPPSLLDFATVFSHFTGRSRLLFCGLLLGGFYATFLAWRERRPWPVGFVAACLLIPLVLSFLASIARPMFLSRYLIICLPFLVLIGAAGLTRLRPPVLARGLVVLLVLVCVTRLIGFYQREGPENWRDATQYVLEASRSGDGFVFFPDYAHKPFDYYSRRNGVPEPPYLDEQGAATKPRIWLVVRESDATANRSAVEQVRSSLAETFQRTAQRRFSNVEVELYLRRAG
jgi:mannosyltransferase